MQGLSLDPTLLPSLATAKVPVATLQNPTSYSFDSENVWDVPGTLLQTGDRLPRRPLGADRPVPHPGKRGRRPIRPAPAPARTVHRRRRPGHYHTKVKYPDNGSFSTSLASLAAMLHAGFPIRAAALQAPGEYDTHSEESGPLSQGLQETSQALAASSTISSSATSGSGGHADLERVRPPSRSRTTPTAQTTERPESPSCSASGSSTGWSASSRVLAADSTRTGTSGRRSTTAPSTSRSPRSGFGVDGDLILPDGKSMPGSP